MVSRFFLVILIYFVLVQTTILVVNLLEPLVHRKQVLDIVKEIKLIIQSQQSELVHQIFRNCAIITVACVGINFWVFITHETGVFFILLIMHFTLIWQARIIQIYIGIKAIYLELNSINDETEATYRSKLKLTALEINHSVDEWKDRYEKIYSMVKVLNECFQYSILWMLAGFALTILYCTYFGILSYFHDYPFVNSQGNFLLSILQ